mmetsp:Transcript_12007/g.39301  ORF Transcript_12007/g.39301 Transcript_12007/m.39301 type:complete len:112 (+) Transcript_12007:77-412(+)
MYIYCVCVVVCVFKLVCVCVGVCVCVEREREREREKEEREKREERGGGRRCAAVVQDREHLWVSVASDANCPRRKNTCENNLEALPRVPVFTLIRTDTTLDLSQKAEKGKS